MTYSIIGILAAMILVIINRDAFWRPEGKKLTGRERMRIITEASTAWDVFVLIRLISRVRIISIICTAKG